jgi:hypothetical protein
MVRNEITISECVELGRDLFAGVISRQEFLKQLSQASGRNLCDEPHLDTIVQVLQWANARPASTDPKCR